MSDELFPDVDRRPKAERPADVSPRFETANRDQVELTPTDLESLLPPGHAARLVWRFTEGLDLSVWYAAIRAREGHAGRTPIDPKILVALWLYATIDGVGSAREVERLCYAHDAYRWLRGGVSVNYHTLSDFRHGHPEAISQLLTDGIATLLREGIVTLARVAQDGTRVRASAGTGSFRRGPSLQECLRDARKQVERTARQGEGPVSAAQTRAASDRLARVEAALAQLPAVDAIKAKHGKRQRPRSEARVSTTDPDARIMKTASGGFRPSYNLQFATDVGSGIIVGVQTTNDGSDRALLPPMLEEIAQRTGRQPVEYLVDGGYYRRASITDAAAAGITVYCPLPKTKGDAHAQPDDSAAVTAWRARMATPEAQTIYRDRARTAEWVHADARTHRTLTQLAVRGLTKVHTWALWAALVHNMLRVTHIVPHLMT